MKCGALWVWDWSWQILGAIHAGRSAEPGEIFGHVNNARVYRFPVSQISRNLNITRRSLSQWILSEQNFQKKKFSVRGRFLKKRKKIEFFQRLATSGRHNSTMIIDRRKFVTKWFLYGMSSFHFTVGINDQVIPWPVQETYPQKSFFCDVARVTSRHADDLSGRGLMTSLGQGKDRSFNKITGNSAVNCTSIVGNWYISNAAITLATVLATLSVLFCDGTCRYSVPAPFFMLHIQM